MISGAWRIQEIGSSQRWQRRQAKDPYVERAAREGWRSRAVFKLIEIQARRRILRPGMAVLDLGASPGAWSQYAAKKVGSRGRVWALDLLPMDPIRGVTFVQGDFTEPETLAQLTRALERSRLDLVMSDLAPNISGHRMLDQSRALALADEALALAGELLTPGGDFLVKLFQGQGFEAFVKDARARFQTARLIKPKASRPESREMYLLARNYGM